MKGNNHLEFELPEPLTEEEQNKLFQELLNDHIEVREKLIMHNMRLVLFIINKYFRSLDNFHEFVSIGIIGLEKAIDTFNINKKTKFVSYASTCIHNEIAMFLRKQVKENNIYSLDELINIDTNFDTGLTLIDNISDNRDITLDYERRELINVIHQFVLELPEREKYIIMCYFGFINEKEYTQVEIANLLNVTQPTVSRIIKEVLNELTNFLITNEYIERKSLVKK